MDIQESLRLPYRLELTHPSLPDPSRLKRLLCPTMLIQVSTVDPLMSAASTCAIIGIYPPILSISGASLVTTIVQLGGVTISI